MGVTVTLLFFTATVPHFDLTEVGVPTSLPWSRNAFLTQCPLILQVTVLSGGGSADALALPLCGLIIGVKLHPQHVATTLALATVTAWRLTVAAKAAWHHRRSRGTADRWAARVVLAGYAAATVYIVVVFLGPTLHDLWVYGWKGLFIRTWRFLADATKTAGPKPS